MTIPSNSAHPSRREDKALPRCLTRLLEPDGLLAGYVAEPAIAAESAGGRTYARALGLLWLDLDRLAQLTPSRSGQRPV